MDSLDITARLAGWLAYGHRTDPDALGGPPIGSDGKLPLLVLLFGLIAAFIGIRINARLIRKGVRWWPGNFEHGDVHVHHVVFGFALMVIAGILEFALELHGIPHLVIALLFGGGMGIALDEFALILHIKDVYWQEEGRTSIDAVIIVSAFILMLLIGLAPFGIGDPALALSLWVLVVGVAVQAAFVLITLVKGKLLTGVVGIFLPIFAWIGALRLAKPGSPWAYRQYPEGSVKLARARLRRSRWERGAGRLRERAFDIVGGKPNLAARQQEDRVARTPAQPSAGGGADAPRTELVDGSGAARPQPAQL